MSHDPDPLTGPPGSSGGFTSPGSPTDPLAAALAKLEPAPAAVNRDGLMFTAGAASRTVVIRLWQFAAGFMTFVGFFAGLQYGRTPSVSVEHPSPAVERGPPHEPPPAAPAAPSRAEREPEKPAPQPESPASPPVASGSQPFYFSTKPPSNDAAGWLQMRNDVLTGGLGMLPDPNHHPTSAKK